MKHTPGREAGTSPRAPLPEKNAAARSRKREPGSGVVAEAEAATGRSRERATIGIAQAGTDGRMLWADDACCAILGVTHERLLARELADLFRSDDSAGHRAELRRVLQGEQPRCTFDTGHFQDDGTATSISVTASYVQSREDAPAHVIVLVEDRSRLNQAQEARHRSEQEAAARAGQFAAMFEAMADGVCFYDRDVRIMEINPAYRALLALDARPDYPFLPLAERLRLISYRDGQGQPFPEGQSLPLRVLNGEVLTGTDAVDFVMRGLDGRDVFVNASGGPVRDADGAVVGGVLILRDVSERRRLERQVQEAAREAEARASQLEAIFEAMADAVLVFDADGHVLKVNAVDTEAFGTSARPDVNHLALNERGRLFDLRDAQGQPLTEAEWPSTHVLQGEVFSGARAPDVLFRTLDGRDRLFNVAGAPVRDAEGTIVGGVLIRRDVTERRRLERQTHEALTALLAIAEALVSERPDGAAEPTTNTAGVAQRLANLTRTVLRCQRVAIVPVGPRAEVLPTWATNGPVPAEESMQWLAYAPQPDQRHLQDFLPTEIIARLHAGELIPIDRRQPPFDRWPNPLGWRSMVVVPLLLGRQLVGVLMLEYGPDEHECSPDERALAAGVARLTTLVIEHERLLREREEARANAMALQEANRRMDEFLGIAAHELKTPVTSSSLCVGLGTQRVRDLVERLAPVAARGDELPELAELAYELGGELGAIQGLLSGADDSMERLQRLVVDLLDVSRIRAGRLELRPEPCDLNAVVRGAVEEQRHLTPARTIRLHLPDRKAVPVVADADRVRQVVANYLTNALKYSAEERPVDVFVRMRDEWARVSVRDDGPGLPRAEHQRVWERFHRVESVEVVSGTGIGLGLGLHICKTIVEQHHGRVGVRSAPGRGSTFWFALPLDRRR